MGVATISIRPRETQANTVANLVETANALWQAVEDAGMVRVSNTSYTGQAGRLVTGTPGTDQTQVTALGTTTGSGAAYYNVYKHPTLNFYVRINVTDFSSTSTSSRWVIVGYGLFFDLDGAGSHVTSGYATYSVQINYTGGTTGTGATGVPTTYKNAFVSVGGDHFCISGEPNNYPKISTSCVTFAYAPGKTMWGFSVFADTDGAGSLVVAMPAYSANTDGSTFSWGLNAAGGGANNAYQYTAIRYWSYEPGAKSPIFRGGAAAGFITDPATPNAGNGTRVQQGQLYINGVLRRFNFGFVAEASLADQTVVELNLTGTGEKKYRVAKAYGPANPGISTTDTSAAFDTTSNSCILLPWNAP